MEEENKNPTPNQEEEKKDVSTITDSLISSFLENFEPAEKITENPEFKSTLDIIEEMNSIAEVEKWEINEVLKNSGFKIKYIEGSFYWILYPKK